MKPQAEEIMTMKHYSLICAFLLIFGTAGAQEKKSTIADFAWLAGCWDGSGGGRESLEQWMKPSGQEEAAFKLVKFENNEAVFENPEHDFSQRIIYRLEKDGSLAAAIEGMSKGKLKRIDFPMKRVKCDP
jgi:Domain of unknown function (DUF6265)